MSPIAAYHNPQGPPNHLGRRKGFRKSQTFEAGGRYLAQSFKSCRTFARIPARLKAPLLNMTDRKKAFAVFGLMSIRQAICLVVHPGIRSSRAAVSPVASGEISARLATGQGAPGFSPAKPERSVLRGLANWISWRTRGLGNASFLMQVRRRISGLRNRSAEEAANRSFASENRHRLRAEPAGKRGSTQPHHSYKEAGGNHQAIKARENPILAF